MRITTQDFYSTILSGIQQNLQSQLTDTNQISSGKALSSDSDNPSKLQQAVDYQTQLSSIGQYQQAISSAQVPLQSLDSSLTNLNNILTSANEQALSGANSTMDASSRVMISDQVQQLFNSAVSTANTQVSGRYIFGGFQSNVNPIDPSTGEFISDSNSVNVSVANDINVTTNVSAGSLFSFKRVNTTDSSQAILPTYNWQNGGANTIPDADPSSALVTTAPAAGNFTSSGNIFTANGGSLSIAVNGSTTPSSGAFVINSSNDQIKIDGTQYTLASGVYTGAGLATALSGFVSSVGFTYNASAHTFDITSSGADTLDLSNSTISSIMGFKSAASQTLNTAGINSDNAVGDVNLAAGSTIQDVRDAINTAGAGAKAQVVNTGTSEAPDYSLVVASDPVGSSANIDISVLSNALTTTGTADASGTGVNMLSYDNTTGDNMKLETDINNYNDIALKSANDNIVIDSGATNDFVIDPNHNTINFIDTSNGNISYTATIPAGTYASGTALATAIQNSLNGAPTLNGTTDSGGVTKINNPFTVVYSNNKFTIANTEANDNMSIVWTGAGSGTAIPQQFGFTSAASLLNAGGGSAASATSVSGTPGPANGADTNDIISNNQIVANIGGTTITAAIPRGTYTNSGKIPPLSSDLATAVQNALDTAAAALGKSDTYTVTYDPNAKKFTIAGNSANPDATTLDWSNKSSTAGQLLGFNSTDESTAIAVNAGSNDIYFEDTAGAGTFYTATIAPGTYNTGADFAAAVQEALNAQVNGVNNSGGTAMNNPFAVTYSNSKLTITNSDAHDSMKILWTNPATTINPAQLGYSVVSSTVNSGGGTAAAGSSISLDGQSDNPVLANYYSFNNNNLNDSNILRALNFENQSLLNNDNGRISQSIKYLGDLSDTVSQVQSSVGARENEVSMEGTFQGSSATNIQTFLSNTQDTDIAKVSTDLTQRQATLQALDTIASTILNQNLFDFIKL